MKTTLNDNRAPLLAPLLRGVWLPPIMEPVVYDCFGVVCVDDLDTPAVASLTLSDFRMFIGDPSSPNARSFVETTPPPFYLLPSEAGWSALVLERAEGFRQERFLFSPTGLERSRIEELAAPRFGGYELRRFDREAVLEAVSSSWSQSFVENFESVEDFLERGFAFGIFHRGRLVAGASSFTLAGRRCEIEVDTDPGYRRRGLATLASARLVLHCLDSGLVPHWDAANEASCALAGKLGFTLERSYEVLRVERSLRASRRGFRRSAGA